MRITVTTTEPQAISLLRDDCGILRSLQAAEGPDPRIKVQDNEAGTLDRSMN
ncbi:MAG: hypothetical protein OXH47_10060 [Paracoccaceae bacterium]|nr:hypothetical protein [Paracoccaceae bacterium]